jgi:predicted permease
MRLLTDLRSDLRHGLRLIARYRAFSAVSIATLAVAIGGNTAVFSMVNALLLTPPPVAEPARLARLDIGQSLASWPMYVDVRDRADGFAGVAAARLTSMGLDDRGAVSRLTGQVTSANYLPVLGVAPERGRTYADAGSAGRVVLAHHVWRQRYGADPAIVGRPIVLGGRTFEIVGVMPAGFRALAPPGVRLDFWIPLDEARDRVSLGDRSSTQFEIVGRLEPDVPHSAGTAALRAVTAQLRAEHPDLPESVLAAEAVPVEGVHAFRGMASLLLPVFAFLALLTIVSGFVLVIGCANIAGLLIGRAAARQRELAVRMSVGSTRGRLLRQLLTESLVLAGCGGGAGLLLAIGLVRGVSAAVTRLPTPLDLDFVVDLRVLGYVVALSTASAVAFGLLPARKALRADLVSSLKADGSGSPARQRLRRVLVTTQVGICAALVAWSVLFLRSMGNVHAIEPGFDASGVQLATVELNRGAIDAENGDRILTEWTRRVAAAPGVESAAIGLVVPLALTGREEFDVSLPGDAAGTDRRVVANRITPGWLSILRIPLLAGRDFTPDDRAGAPDVAIVNETMARQFWGPDALGQDVRFGDRTLRVVGVARDSKYRTLGEAPRPLIYLPFRQHYAHFVTLFARTSDPRGAARVMTAELDALQPGATVSVESMADAVAVAVLPARIGAAVTGVFALVAVVLAACGVYALVSFSVGQRTREFGIRRAVGAGTEDIVRLVLRHHAAPLVVGLFTGGAAGALGAMLIRGFLAGVGPTARLAPIVAVGVVGGSAVAASTLPARRAARIEPSVALRDT